MDEQAALKAVRDDSRVGIVALVLSDDFGGRPERTIGTAVKVIAELDRLGADQRTTDTTRAYTEGVTHW